MEKIQKQITSTTTIFVASDGTEFSSDAQCKRYEESAECAIKEALYKYRTNPTIFDDSAWIIDGGNEGSCFGVILSSDDALYAARVFFKHFENIHAAQKITDELLGKRVIIFGNYDSTCFWWKTEEMIKERLEEIFTPKSKETN